MNKGSITDKDVVLILLSYRKETPFSSIKKDLPAENKKNITYTLQEMICDELIDYKERTEPKKEKYYHLTSGGKKLLGKRVFELGQDDKTANRLEEIMYAFGQ